MSNIEWCAAFVSSVASVVGLTGKCIAKSASASGIVRESVKANMGTFHKGPSQGGTYRPVKGDLIQFRHSNTTITDEYSAGHVGIVAEVVEQNIYTIEGNTNNGSTIIANGGSVCSKSYNNSNLPGTKFCRPDYSIVKSIMNSSSTSKPSTTTYNKWVGAATKDGTDVFANPTGTSKLSTYPKLNKGNLVDVIGVSGTRYQVKIADKFVGYVEKSNIKDPNAVVTKPSASTSKTKYPFVGEVTASELNVRTGTGTNYGKLSSYPILKRGNLVDVLKAKKDTSGNKWYQVRIAGKYTGYVSAQYIKKK